MRHLLYGRTALSRTALSRAAVAVTAAALAGALLASCASDGGIDSESQIKQVTQDYISAVNTGKVSATPALVCAKYAAKLPATGSDQPPSAKQAQIDSFDQIQISGDSATARLTVSVKGDSTIPAENVDMSFVNENGWKICQ